MLPQGRLLRGAGAPRRACQVTAPVAAFSAYTLSFSVATTTRLPISSGCPYTAPSRLARQVTRRLDGAGTPSATPARSGVRLYIGQAAAGCAAPLLPVVAGSVRVPGDLGPPGVMPSGDPPPPPAGEDAVAPEHAVTTHTANAMPVKAAQRARGIMYRL